MDPSVVVTRTPDAPPEWRRGEIRTYRMAGSFRRKASLTAVAGLVIAAWMFSRLLERTRGPELVLLAAIGAIAALCGVVPLAALRAEVTLAADAVRVRRLLGSEHLRRLDVQGVQLLRDRAIPTLVLHPRAGTGRRLEIPCVLQVDSAWASWFEWVSGGEVRLASPAAQDESEG